MFSTFDFVARIALFGFILVAFVFAIYYVHHTVKDKIDDMELDDLLKKYYAALGKRRKG
jgi:hypothetical protein